SEKDDNLLIFLCSKGLEFEYVFFDGCNAATWEKKRKPGGGYKYPDTLFASRTKSADDPAGAGNSAVSDEEELRRLFYVALTRVEVHLVISWSRFRDDGKELEPSVFIAEIQEEHVLPVEKIEIPAEEQANF